MKLFMSKIWVYLKPLLIRLATEEGEMVFTVALEAVLNAQVLTGATGQTKRNAAFKAILNSLKTKGIAIATSEINKNIEEALAALKANGKIPK